MFSISLFHGRNTPTEQLEDWGFLGPIIKNVGFAWTYGCLKIFDIQPDGSLGEMILLPQTNGLIALGSKYYGDFELISNTDPIALDTEREQLTFLQLKELVAATVVPNYADLRKEAVKEVTDYFIMGERDNLEEHINDEYGTDQEPENMSDEELYAYCIENDISHVWCQLHLLSL